MNQISNTRLNKKTTELEKEIIETDKEMSNRIISILEDLKLIRINTTIHGSPIEYSESINDKYEDFDKDYINSIIQRKCDSQ